MGLNATLDTIEARGEEPLAFQLLMALGREGSPLRLAATFLSPIESINDGEAAQLLASAGEPAPLDSMIATLKHLPGIVWRGKDTWGISTGPRWELLTSLLNLTDSSRGVLECALGISGNRYKGFRNRVGSEDPRTRIARTMFVDTAAAADPGIARSEFLALTVDCLSRQVEDVRPLLSLRNRWAQTLTPDAAVGTFYEALARYQLGDRAEARRLFQNTLDALPDSEYAMVAWHLVAKLEAHFNRDRWASTERSLLESLRLNQEFQNRPGEMVVETSLARSFCDQGRYEESMAAAERAEAIANELGLPESDALLVTRAVSLYRLKEYGKAIDALRGGANRLLRAGDERALAKVVNTLGRALALRAEPGDRDAAIRAYEESLEIGQRLRMAKHVGIVANGLARALMDRRQKGDLGRARALLETAKRAHSAISYRYGLEMASRSLDELDQLAERLDADVSDDCGGFPAIISQESPPVCDERSATGGLSRPRR